MTDRLPPPGGPAAVLDGLAALETRHGEVTFETLRRSLLAGDEEAWRCLVGKYSRFVYAVAMKSIAGLPDREETASAIYLRVFERLAANGFALLKGFEGRCRFTTYLYRVVLSARKDLLARRPAERTAGSPEDAVGEVPDPGPSPVSSLPPLQADALRRAVREALDRLDPGDRLLLLWRYRDGLKLREIATVAGLKDTNAAAWAVRKAVERLEPLKRLREERHFGETEIASMEAALREELLEDPPAAKGAAAKGRGHGRAEE